MADEAAGSPLEYPFSDEPGLGLDPRYAQLRSATPVARVALPYGGDAWLVTGHAESKDVLTDPRLSRAAATGPDSARFTPRPLPASMLQSMDPPEHTRLRRLVAKAFTARRVERLRPSTQVIVDELLDRIEDHGPPADLVELFALPLPLIVICELLGVPYSDREQFRRFSGAMLSTTAFTAEEVATATAELESYLAELIAQRRRHPQDDLLSALAQARDDGSRLSAQEMLMLGIVILVGGHETTANQIANCTYMLLTRPEWLAALREDPASTAVAVEELLRLIPLGSAGSFPRVALEDVAVGGVTIRAGDTVITHAAAANRDERIFSTPDRLDLTREENPHLAFGHGAHHCLGSRLARMELRVAVRSLVERFPALRMAIPEEKVAWKEGIVLRGPVELPLAW
jgi:cytochrome P450